ncbi:hypothetical protein LXA43DRAFT_1176686 [Ganoderma leucocontextum]|nr:hypothetical protein LXA43DRAFT_1176686 [Ganoderma leucocontextum]
MCAHLLPGGDWLVAVADINLDPKDALKSTGVSLWDLRDVSNPRCVVNLSRKGLDCPSTAVELDKERGIARLVLGYFLTPNQPQNKLERYDLPLDDKRTKPEAYEVSIPSHPSQSQETYIRDTTRWLHPQRHTSSLHSSQVLFDDNDLYLLGRTPTTYILRRYHFSPNLLIKCADDTFLDPGEPLIEYEGPPLPDPGIPWGSCDSEDVHLEPSSHLSVLMLRSWFGEGQYLRFRPLRSGDQPPGADRRSWLGRDQAMTFSDDDFSPEDKNRLLRLSFPHSDPKDVSRSDRGAAVPTGRVCREDLLTEESPVVEETDVLTRPSALSVDEESGRICVLLMNGKGLILSQRVA